MKGIVALMSLFALFILGYLSVTATLPPIYAMAGWIMAAAWVTLYVLETK